MLFSIDQRIEDDGDESARRGCIPFCVPDVNDLNVISFDGDRDRQPDKWIHNERRAGQERRRTSVSDRIGVMLLEGNFSFSEIVERENKKDVVLL